MLIEELKIKVETFYALQKLRIQSELRIQAFQRDKRLNEKNAKRLHLWADELLEKMETNIMKDVSLIIRDVPIYHQWLKGVNGVGPALAGSLIAGIQDITRFVTVSKLWAYSYGKVVDGEAARRAQGSKIHWNPFLRMTMYKITDSFLKQKPENCQYRRIYDDAKAYYMEKYPEWKVCRKCGEMLRLTVMQAGKDGKPDKMGWKCPECGGTSGGIEHPTRKTKKGEPVYIHNLGHLHNMAKRKAGKVFLQHLMVRWYELEGLKIPGVEPYIIGREGHSHLIEPDVPLGKPKKEKHDEEK